MDTSSNDKPLPDIMSLMTIKYTDLSNFSSMVGKGSFGKVVKADYLGTEVAVKECLRVTENGSFDFEKYLRREIDALKEARHPNIVQFMGICMEGSKIFIVTEYVSAGNVKEWITNETDTFSLEQNLQLSSGQHLLGSAHPNETEARHLNSYRLRLSFATDTARALAFLHAHDIIHRDIKPSNLLLTENLRVKLCDFGFARVIEKRPKDKRTLTFLGTEGFMAPELVLCLDEYDHTVDIFSFGVILLSLLVLRIPKGDGPAEPAPFRRVIPGFGLDSESIRNCVPRDIPNRDKICDVVIGCVDDDPKKRMSLKEALSILKENETITTRKLRELKTPIPLHFGTLESQATPTGSEASTGNSTPTTINSMNSPDHHRTLSLLSEYVLTKNERKSASLTNISIEPSSDSTPRQQPNLVPHRFTIVFSPLTLSPFKCSYCSKSLGKFMRSYLECDDCGYKCHKKCSAKVPLNCGRTGGTMRSSKLKLAISMTEVTPTTEEPQQQQQDQPISHSHI